MSKEYELDEEDVDLITSSVLAARDRFRAYEHNNDEDNLVDIAYAGKLQDLLERVFHIEDWPEVQLKDE